VVTEQRLERARVTPTSALDAVVRGLLTRAACVDVASLPFYKVARWSRTGGAWSSRATAMLIETVRQVRAALLILDIMMPGPNGFETYDSSVRSSTSAASAT
jgi:CheY-like chemotaxis protein